MIRGKVQDAAHECNKADLETAELIRSSCKPCPKCGEAIEKQSGCDMMFCTSCHTPFSWRTMEIITRGNIHNPHYFEWRNRVGAGGAAGAAHAAEPLPCGGMPRDYFIYERNSARKYIYNDDIREQLSDRYRITAHIEDITAGQYAAHTEIQNTEKYRIDYLLKDRTKQEIESILQVEERTRERHKAIRDVLDTYLVAAAEQFRIVSESTYREPEETQDVAEETARQAIFELDQLRDFINETLINVHKAYGCSVPQIDNAWVDVDIYNTQKARKQKKQEEADAADPVIVDLKTKIATIGANICRYNRQLDEIRRENRGIAAGQG